MPVVTSLLPDHLRGRVVLRDGAGALGADCRPARRRLGAGVPGASMGSSGVMQVKPKWDSPEDKYRCAAVGLTRGQMQLQSDMFTRLLGLAPDRVHSVLLARRPRRRHAAAAAAAAAAEPVVIPWGRRPLAASAGASSPAVRAVLPDAAIAG